MSTVTFTSSNTSVATVSGSIITFVGAGDSIITLTQAETDEYEAASVPATCTVLANTASNPTQITTGTGLEYYVNNTTAEYGDIDNNISISENLVALSYKVITSSQFVTITKV
jgi:hypothetical protein